MHARIVARSRESRAAYLRQVVREGARAADGGGLSCGNLAHACAANSSEEKKIIFGGRAPNLGIITAYNDMLSAHRPFENYPEIIRQAARQCGATAQVAGGVPAMCDGVTQGRPGMELSLFSRDVIAMASAVALSHNTYSAAMFLGVCDKIVPGMLTAAACFGHLPAMFVPAGPMPSGLENEKKAKIRQQFAAGKIGREELLAAEAASYHAPGTCTFYGTANTNQMMLELMGLQLPGTSFVNPGSPLRDALTRAAVRQLCDNVKSKAVAADMLSPAAFVNAMVGVLATGGSTNHLLHLPAMARACGVLLEWRDFADLSEATPLLCRLYPNGRADVNHFHAAGGMAFLVGELRAGGLLMEEVKTVVGDGLAAYATEPFLQDGEIVWRDGGGKSLDEELLRSVSSPFSSQGGLAVLEGNLGRSVVKVSAIPPGLKKVEAPARIFESQEALMHAFAGGGMNEDMVCVVRFQGPRANGMPELHKLTPLLATLQDAGRRVALITDGRMSGASGRVPAAIHLTPEAAAGGAIAKLQDGDKICMDWSAKVLHAEVDEKTMQSRPAASGDLEANQTGYGRELFSWMRAASVPATQGGGVLLDSNHFADRA